jgi:hypothetical protein
MNHGRQWPRLKFFSNLLALAIPRSILKLNSSETRGLAFRCLMHDNRHSNASGVASSFGTKIEASRPSVDVIPWDSQLATDLDLDRRTER